MSTEVAGVPPPVLWAQRTDAVYLTFNVECKDPDIRFEKDSVSFKGVGLPENKLYQVTIPLYDNIIPEECVKHNIGRCIEVFILKENKTSPFWPSLTKDKKKYHWIKVDFSKMQDDNDTDDETTGVKYANSAMMELFKAAGELNENSDNPEKPSFDETSDSDDDDIPELE